MRIRQERIKTDFARIAACGRLENGGVTRLAFSAADLQARQYLHQAMLAADLRVSVDAAGNMRGRRDGLSDLSPVMLGSHLDTVPNGGHYDGVIGVLAALEVIRALDDEGVATRRPIEVVNFSAEESSRFGVATLGSKALVGALGPDDFGRLTDQDGVSVRQALADAGYGREASASPQLAVGDVHAFLELHIEQGPVLEQARCPVGIVTAIAAPTRFRVTVTGRADHSGTTPMALRRDALAGAGEIVLGVERIASHEAGSSTVGTVGYLWVQPGAMNVVPERVELGIDLRDIDSAAKRNAVRQVTELMDAVAARRGLQIDYEKLCDDEPVQLSQKVTERLEQIAAAADIPVMKLHSGAGHDAMNLARITNVGMIFVPSVAGISHNIAEKSRMEDICRGAELLLRATVDLADEG